MRLSARRLVVFGAQFLIFFVAFLLFYPVLLPIYNGLALSLANVVLAHYSPPLYVQTTADHSWMIYRLPEKRPLFTLEGSYLSLIYLNLALLPALILATPLPSQQRLKLLGWGMAALLGVHALSAIALTRAEICVHYDPGNMGCNVVEGIFGTGGQLFAVALWAVLTWRVWLPMKALKRGIP
ncbi:MAG: hypothetical protein NZ930_01170 [Candidatus Bipolaricaulota bacterium]|nr:hypothetical protein [Candidatus Bipolaricaulota bacterium]MDW8031313.1 hypothetical protein [Candidatus Bipolaricaulota bacterium]